MCFAHAMRLFFCSYFIYFLFFYFIKGTCGSFLEHGVGIFIFFYFIGTWGSFGCVHGEVRSFTEYGVVL